MSDVLINKNYIEYLYIIFPHFIFLGLLIFYFFQNQ